MKKFVMYLGSVIGLLSVSVGIPLSILLICNFLIDIDVSLKNYLLTFCFLVMIRQLAEQTAKK